MDVSKAFDILNHELLIAKLSAYGFTNESLKLIESCLTNWRQRTKVNESESFSKWAELLQRVSQNHFWTKIGVTNILESNKQRLLGVQTDKKIISW